MGAELDISTVFGAAVARSERFAVYVPSKDRDGNPVDQAVWIDRCLRLLSSINGGATAMPPLRGAWLNTSNDSLVIEEPVVVYSFVEPHRFVERIDEIAALADEIARETNQGQMAIEFNQTMFLIDY